MFSQFILAAVLSFSFHLSSSQDISCDSVYTIGSDELCMVDLITFDENCTTFNASYDIAATNGLTIDPSNGDIYIVASIGSNQGDRVLYRLDQTTFSLEEIGVYTSGNDKLVGIAFTCETSTHSSQLYGITGAQADHSLYTVDIDNNGALSRVGNLDYSTVGNGLAYSFYDDSLYRVGGDGTIIDIESIDYKTVTPNVTIERNDYINDTRIDKVRAIGHYLYDYLFLIDGDEYLYLVNTLDGGDIVNVTQLSSARQHKGIICTNFEQLCELVEDDETTEEPTTTRDNTLPFSTETSGGGEETGGEGEGSGSGSSSDGFKLGGGVVVASFVFFSLFFVKLQ